MPPACFWFFLVHLAAVGTIRFDSLEGRTADPCNEYLWLSPDATDCSSVPSPQTVVLLPSETSAHPRLPTSLGGSYVLTLTGQGFDRLASGSLVGVSKAGGLCAAVDSAQGVANVTVISSTHLTFHLPVNWTLVDMELETEARRLCFNATGYIHTSPPPTLLTPSRAPPPVVRSPLIHPPQGSTDTRA